MNNRTVSRADLAEYECSVLLFSKAGHGTNLRLLMHPCPISESILYEVRHNDQLYYLGGDLDEAIYEFNLLVAKS